MQDIKNTGDSISGAEVWKPATSKPGGLTFYSTPFCWSSTKPPSVSKSESAPLPYRHQGVGEHHQQLVRLGAHVPAGALAAAAPLAAGGAGRRSGRPGGAAQQVPAGAGGRGLPRCLQPQLQLPQRCAQLPPLRQQEKRPGGAERRQQPHGGQQCPQRPAARSLHRRRAAAAGGEGFMAPPRWALWRGRHGAARPIRAPPSPLHPRGAPVPALRTTPAVPGSGSWAISSLVSFLEAEMPAVRERRVGKSLPVCCQVAALAGSLHS